MSLRGRALIDCVSSGNGAHAADSACRDRRLSDLHRDRSAANPPAALREDTVSLGNPPRDNGPEEDPFPSAVALTQLGTRGRKGGRFI